MGLTGYASVRRAPNATVHGMLFDLALADVAALDLYEDVAHGLYTRSSMRWRWGRERRAARSCTMGSTRARVGAPTGYMEGVVAAARAAALPPAYVASLEAHLPRGRP